MAGLSNKKDQDAAAAKRRELEAQHGLSAQPAQPSPAPAEPAPEPVAAEPPPTATPPAEPEPAPAPDPPTLPAQAAGDPGTVSRSLHDAEKARWANAHTTLRSNANQLLSQKDQMIASLQEENRALRSQPQPAQVDPAAGGLPSQNPFPAGNGNGSEWTPEEQQVLSRMREEHGAPFMDELFQLQDARMQRQIMANYQGIEQRFEQLHDQLGMVQDNQLRDETALFEQQMADMGHPDWEQLRLSPEFQNWMMEHPMGKIYWGLMLPQQAGMGADSQQMSQIISEYKTQHPASLAASNRDLEAEARATAAALANRGAPLVGSELPPAAPADYLMVSDLGDLTRRHANDPAKVKELRERMEASLQSGRLVDNMSGHAPVAFQGAAVP